MGCPAAQEPALSQTPPSLAMPFEQVGEPQVIAVPGYRHEGLCPSHPPAQVGSDAVHAPCPGCGDTSLPSVVHLPSVPDMSQAWHVPVQAPSQQRPSAQKPSAHSEATEHVAPRALPDGRSGPVSKPDGATSGMMVGLSVGVSETVSTSRRPSEFEARSTAFGISMAGALSTSGATSTAPDPSMPSTTSIKEIPSAPPPSRPDGTFSHSPT